MNEIERLDTKKVRAVAALLEASTVAEAARRADVGESTLRRWTGEPAFQAMLKEAEADLLAQTTRRLAGLLGKAVDTIESVLDSQESDSVRVKAAVQILDRWNTRKITEQEERINELEKIVGYGNKSYLRPIS